MPESRKRRLIQEEEDDEEDLGRDPSPPSAQVSGDRSAVHDKAKAVKKARHEEEPAEEQVSFLDEDEGEDDDEGDTRREEPEGQGWEADDAATAATEGSDWKEQAELEFEKSKTRGPNGLVAEIGVIEMIEMFDFMCHRHLKVSFGPKINFIIGHNGSGKSAILSAIMVCLGGKANVTNRAQSLKALIREGATQAEVKLQLRNRGSDAFKPTVYGESIIIERRISNEGASVYKIKSAAGKTISTKREELTAICDHMNIQVDNPMNVLSQDTARQFLQASTPEEKYKFFMRGTHLTQLSQDYEMIRECVDIMQSTIRNKAELLPELHEMAKTAQARFKDSQQAITLELEVESLKKQVAWAQIVELENEAEEAKTTLRDLTKKITAIEKKRAQDEQAGAELDGRIEEVERTMEENANSTAPALEKKKQLEQEYRDLRNELKTLNEDERTVNDEIKRLKETVLDFDRRIEQETKKLQANTQSHRIEIENKIERLRTEVDQLKRQYAEKKESYETLAQQVDECRNRSEQVNSVVRKAKSELKESNERIQLLEGQKQNFLKAFGPTIPEVLHAIQDVTERGGWKGETPVGPLGRHVKLREQRWAPAIESALGNVLNAFAVTTDSDRSVLLNILRRHRWALGFDDEWVRRLLIDKNSIESTILVEKRSDADRITSSGPGGGFPENVTGCFTIDLIRVGDRSGGAASIMMNRYRGPPRLTTNVDQEQMELEGTSRRLEDSIRYRMREFQELLDEAETKDRDRLETKKDLTNMSKEIRLKETAADNLQENLQDDDTTNLTAYQESKAQKLTQIETMKKQYEPIARQKQVITANIEPIKDQINQVSESISSQEAKTMKIRAKLENLNKEKQHILPKIQHWNKSLENTREAVRDAEADLDRRTKHLEDSTAQATDYCERVEVNEKPDKLERKIKQIQDRLREQEAQRGCTVEELELEMRRKVEEYKTAKAAIHNMNRLIAVFKSALHTRISRWSEFRKQMALRAKINFSLQLSQRGYSGELKFKFKEQTLDITVETEDQRSREAGVSRDKDPKSLSGGEKSFSTICLLLALWDCMFCSIRCLDEFDVFMDAVNRRISMKMLIEAARKSDSVQYILITPQDASSVSPGPDVRVHRLHDPERNQQTLV
ncbi:Structural maintenance of chromosomes protein 6 [Mortierella sp. GBA43]|nr:Structural maintenance of chromosomes protein 6 [Mortierella sp. GBA43]